MKLSNSDILEILNKLDYECGISDNKVYLYGYFATHDDEEAHDAGWDYLMEIQEELSQYSLILVNVEIDNDTVIGDVVQKEEV
jgi:hypothetical protein